MFKIGKKVKFNDNARPLLRDIKGTIVSETHGFYTVRLDTEVGTLVHLVNESDIHGVRGRPRKI